MRSDLEFVPAIPEDAWVITPFLHDDYRRELLALVNPGDEAFLLQDAIYNSLSATAIWDGVVLVAVLGHFISCPLSGEAHPWCVWSEDVGCYGDLHRRVIGAYAEMVLEDFSVATNWTRADNVKGHELLRGFGFEVSRDPVGISPTGVEMVSYWKSS